MTTTVTSPQEWLDDLNTQTRKLWGDSNWRGKGILPFLFTGFKHESNDSTLSKGVMGQWLWGGWDTKGPFYEVTVPSLVLDGDGLPRQIDASTWPRIYMDTPSDEITRLLREGLKILLQHAAKEGVL